MTCVRACVRACVCVCVLGCFVVVVVVVVFWRVGMGNLLWSNAIAVGTHTGTFYVIFFLTLIGAFVVVSSGEVR